MATPANRSLDNVTGVLPVTHGGTGTRSVAEIRRRFSQPYEPLLASFNGNQDVLYDQGSNLVPDYMMTSEGDLMMAVSN